MATRNPGGTKVDVEGTEFHLHKSQQSIFAGIMHKVIDYTEHRLLRYADKVKDPQQKATLKELITNYKKGLVAIAWRKGQPVWLPVTKDG
jgi:uncharacterized protein (UPF0261 family)